MPTRAHVDRARAEYRYMSLTSLIAMAYKINDAQITGPDWLPGGRWDIAAKMKVRQWTMRPPCCGLCSKSGSIWPCIVRPRTNRCLPWCWGKAG